MFLTPYQIIAPLVSFNAIAYAWNLAMRHKKTVWEAGLWTLFWGAIAFIAIRPNALTYLSAITGIANQENAVIVTFLGILFFVTFALIIRLEELEQRHARLVRKIGLREAGLDEQDTRAKVRQRQRECRLERAFCQPGLLPSCPREDDSSHQPLLERETPLDGELCRERKTYGFPSAGHPFP